MVAGNRSCSAAESLIDSSRSFGRKSSQGREWNWACQHWQRHKQPTEKVHQRTKHGHKSIHSAVPTAATPNTGFHNDIVLIWWLSQSDSLFFPVKTSSLSDHTSKVTGNNGALSKLIHAQGMDWQWRISVSRLYKATQLFPLPYVHNQTSAIQCHKPINAPFVLAWHHCFVFIKISLLWHRHLFVSFPAKLCRSSLFVWTMTLSHIWFFSLLFPGAVTLIHTGFPSKRQWKQHSK